MSGIVQRESNRFDATYGHPWGGIASDADASDIQPSQMVKADGFYIKNGRMCTAQWGYSTAVKFSINPSAGYFFDGEYIKWVFTIVINSNSESPGLRIIALSENSGNAYMAFGGGSFNLNFTLNATPPYSFDSYQIISGVVYIFDFVNHKVYKYTPGVEFIVASSFVGGKYCMVVTNYLITAFTNMPSDASVDPNSSNHPIRPNRFNWSAPFAYSTWDPADAVLPRGAGYNTIASVSDSVTGCFAMGNVGYILRTQGLTQISPTGIGIQPFDTTDLWDSQFGIGCSYPDSFDQYGLLAMWVNDNNVYAFFVGGMPQGIADAIQSDLFADINKYENTDGVYTRVSGAISNTSENSRNPELTYSLAILYNTVGSKILGCVVWTYTWSTKSWTRQTPDLNKQIEALTGDTSEYTVVSFNAMGVFQCPQGNGSIPITKRIRSNLVLAIFRSAPVTSLNGASSFLFSLYYNEGGISSGCPTIAAGFPADVKMPINATFRQEELRLGIKPTVRGVIIKAAGTGTLAVQVNDKTFTPIILDGTANAKTYKSYGELSAENPQLMITSDNSDSSIIKASMNLTYAEGSPL